MSNTAKLSVRCVGCKALRYLTKTQLLRGRTFCPRCGNLEIAIISIASGTEKDD